MELRHLRYFVAVAEALSFRKGAERERIAQPALSKQIKDLEDEIGVRLLDRDRAGVRLTDAGIVYLEEAREILQRSRQAMLAAREAEAGRRGRLTVGNVGAISSSFMPATLAAFRDRYPEVDVTLNEMRLPDQIAALLAGTLQVGFATDRTPAMPAQVERMDVLESPICVVIGAGHKLATRSRIALSDLAAERVLSVGDSDREDAHGDRIRAIFAQRGLARATLRRVNSMESLLAMIAGQQGISFLPRLAVMRANEGTLAKTIKEDGPDLRFRLCAVWRRDATSRLARNFIEVLQAVAGKGRR